MEMPFNSFDHYPLTWKPDKGRLKPPYCQSLAADLEHKIKNGLLKAGTKLPPQREIADYLDLNYTTITRVYETCKKKGLIYGVMGKGTFVLPHASEDTILTTENLLEQCIDLGAINGFGEYSTLVEKATCSVVEKGYLRHLYEYSFPAGHPHQLAAGARWMEQMGTHATIENTAVFSGAQNALTVALVSLFSPGDKIAADTYTYPNLIEIAKLLHLVLVPVRGDSEGMLPEELQRQCAANRIKGIYLMPTFSNPTTISLSYSRRKALAQVIQKNGLVLLEDDIATWLVASGTSVTPSMFDILNGESIYICGMTKSLCPGLRIAYMAFGECYRRQILHGLSNINIKTSSFDAEVITELILNGDAYKIAAHKRSLTRKACDLFSGLFSDMYPDDGGMGYFRWIPIPSKQSAHEVETELIKRGIRVYHSQRFMVTTGAGQEYLRVSLCSAGSMKRLETGLKILKEYLR